MRKQSCLWSFLLAGSLALAAAPWRTQAGSDPEILANTSSSQREAFADGLDDFEEQESFATGLGVVFNGKSCAECHSQPVTGGASPSLTVSVVFHIARITNGRFDPMTEFGGSVLQRRSVKEEKPNLSVLGEVVPREATIVSRRQTPPLFGAGLIDAIRPDAILALADPGDRNHDGISGRANMVRNPENGRVEVGRFGWKADVSSLHVFAGLAYVNELGVTNPTFPKENLPSGKPIQPGWDAIAGLEDDGTDTQSLFRFMQLLAPELPRVTNATTTRGKAVFLAIGCGSCHVPAMPAGDAPTRDYRNGRVPLYSDLLLHDMGSGLADGIVAEQATGAEFRTAPLWGLSRRLFYLHDGRARTITPAVEAHGGEAAGAKARYQDISASDRTALLAFLGSL